MINVKNLCKQFDAFTAVDNISFSVNRGDVLGFLGPNGAGKSTTMKMITGFLAPTSGSISVCGHDVLNDPLAAKKTIGYLPEGAPAYPDMTPEQFLRFIAEIRGYKGVELVKRVESAAGKTHLESVMRKPIETLSKGFKRRVGLAQAILHDPEVLIMDEPTDGLDPNQKFEVRHLITDMAKDKAIIISTHILEEVQAVCNRAIIISQGKSVFDGTPAQMEALSRYHNAVTLTLASDALANAEKQLKALSGVKGVESVGNETGKGRFTVFPKDGHSIIEDINRLARDKNWEIDELSIEKGRLDEVFRTITTSSKEVAGGVLS